MDEQPWEFFGTSKQSQGMIEYEQEMKEINDIDCEKNPPDLFQRLLLDDYSGQAYYEEEKEKENKVLYHSDENPKKYSNRKNIYNFFKAPHLKSLQSKYGGAYKKNLIEKFPCFERIFETKYGTKQQFKQMYKIAELKDHWKKFLDSKSLQDYLMKSQSKYEQNFMNEIFSFNELFQNCQKKIQD